MSSENVSFGRRGIFCPIIVIVAALFHISSPLHADSFVMTSGKVIDGSVAGGSDVSVFIKDEDGLLQSVLLADVAEVRIDLSGGEEVVGQLVGFRDDTYKIVTDKWVLFIKEGRMVQSVVIYDDDAPPVVPNVGGPAIGVDKQEPSSEPESTADPEALKHATM